MAVTREQALSADMFHEPREGKSCANWRRNGQSQTWRRSPERFRVPVKYGLYSYGQLTETNAHLLHLPGECPVNGGK